MPSAGLALSEVVLCRQEIGKKVAKHAIKWQKSVKEVQRPGWT
jgi:hypothetical protein